MCLIIVNQSFQILALIACNINFFMIRTGNVMGSELAPEWFEVVDNDSPVFADKSVANRSGH